MKVTSSIEQFVGCARTKAGALGKSLNHLVRNCMQSLAGDDTERSIEEFNRLSGRGHSYGEGFDRSEIHERGQRRAG